MDFLLVFCNSSFRGTICKNQPTYQCINFTNNVCSKELGGDVHSIKFVQVSFLERVEYEFNLWVSLSRRNLLLLAVVIVGGVVSMLLDTIHLYWCL